MVDWRLISLLLWGGIIVVSYGIVFGRRLVAFRSHGRDRRAWREVAFALALFLTALSSGVGVLFALFWPDAGNGARFGYGLAMGCFAAAGVVWATERGNGHRAR